MNAYIKSSPKSMLIWRAAQIAMWILGGLLLFNLIFFPTIGINLFWNILIPIAPMILVLGLGIWRNICPMATTALLPSHVGFSKRKKLTLEQSGKLNLIAVAALFIIAPLRHAFFDMNGLATALLLISMGLIALLVGLTYEWKSVWCSGLCPVHPVEKLYGMNNSFSVPNAHCGLCHRCVVPCPDTTPGIHPLSVKKSKYHQLAGFLMVASFPGFIWGWFHVADAPTLMGVSHLIEIYVPPILGLIVTSILYLILKYFFQFKNLIPIFSAAAISCYYWYRIPALFGFGIFPGDGMLIDLSSFVPEWVMTGVGILTTIFFFWWIVIREEAPRRWVLKPVYANRVKK